MCVALQQCNCSSWYSTRTELYNANTIQHRDEPRFGNETTDRCNMEKGWEGIGIKVKKDGTDL